MATTAPASPVTFRKPRAISRWIARVLVRFRSLTGLRRGFSIDTVYYKETSREPMARALSRMGSGIKQFRVTFPDGTKMFIHCTRERRYADAAQGVAKHRRAGRAPSASGHAPTFVPRLERLAAMFRPGMRILCLPCGTGDAPAWISRQVGRSGAVVAIDPDDESIRYAKKRYAHDNIAFETGALDGLAGEIDGSFDAVVSMRYDQPQDEGDFFRELWRVTAPGGWLLVLRTKMDRAGLAAVLEKELNAAPAPADTRVNVTVDMLCSPDSQDRAALIRKPVAAKK